MQKISIQHSDSFDYKMIQDRSQNKTSKNISNTNFGSLSGLTSDVVSFKGSSANQTNTNSSRSAVEVIANFIQQAVIILQQLIQSLKNIFGKETQNVQEQNKTAETKKSQEQASSAENKVKAETEPLNKEEIKTKTAEVKEVKTKSAKKEAVKKAPVLLLPEHKEPKPLPKKDKVTKLMEQKAKALSKEETEAEEIEEENIFVPEQKEETKPLQPKTEVAEPKEIKAEALKTTDKPEKIYTETTKEPVKEVKKEAPKETKKAPSAVIGLNDEIKPVPLPVVLTQTKKALPFEPKPIEPSKHSRQEINSILYGYRHGFKEAKLTDEEIVKNTDNKPGAHLINKKSKPQKEVKQASEAAVEETAKIRTEETVKPSEETEAADKVQAAAEKATLKNTTQWDFRFYDDSQLKYSRTKDTVTGTETYNWYKQTGEFLGIETRKKDGSNTYLTFADADGKIPFEEFITLPNGKHQYIKYNPNGFVSKKADLEEDNTTVIRLENYYYKEDGETVDKIRTKFADNTSFTTWYADNGKPEVIQFAKDNKALKTRWYYEDGKTVRQTDKYLSSGCIERNSYDKDGNVTLYQLTKPDKVTPQEITVYSYGENGQPAFAQTNYSDGKQTQLWYNESGIPSIFVQFQNGNKTKTVWYYEDGDTPKTEEEYLKDGTKQVLELDKEGRWVSNAEYPSADSTKYTKVTRFSYKDGSENPAYSVIFHSDGKTEKNWFDDNENMTTRQTEINGVISKLEKFYEDGLTLKFLRTYKDGKFEDKHFPRFEKAV